ncbi:TMEM175 family protein [Polaribacter porphyrae]|uniref:Transglutaminase n=1 Tax=Polaribacter porphyrae TaxID=1137780 RepID=A0A2S7WL22_9FLAO|nr:TMEM175 family protein [Polaribacter porphyrae]PQJ78136.1 transglutaminase [Polaribacter porphyrae]
MKFLHSKSRLEALSDGVFAFAATLMVVNIGADTNITSFKDELPNFISFAVSFFVMMGIWKVHYNFFRRTNYIDNWIIALNMILLFTVLFYIFPVRSLLSTGFGGQRINIDEFSNIFQLYSIGFSLIFLSFCLMYFRAFKNDKNLKLLFYSRHFFIFIIVGIISFILAKFQIGLRYGVPGFVYILLGPLCYFHSVKFHKKHNLEY